MRPLLALFVVLGVPAHLGSGDDVVPRDTVSIIESVVPALPPGVQVDVVGGDTFLRVRSRGHAVDVHGYRDEPYIRVSADGTVEENTASETWFLNASRFGGSAPSSLPGGEKWSVTSRDGEVMWHDHRIHWMGRTAPTVIDDRGTVLDWQVPVTVDGTEYLVRGTLVVRHRASPLWWVFGVAAGALALVASLRRRRTFHALVTAVATSVTFVGALQWVALPPAARVTPLLFVFGLAALLASATALALASRRRGGSIDWIASSLSAGAGLSLLIVAWMTVGQVRAAYVPMTGPLWIVRATVTAMTCTAAVAVFDGVVRAVRVPSQQ